MPDISDGLEINGEPARTYEDGDVNAPGGFEAALANKVSGDGVAPEVPEAPQERPRDPETGRFISQAAEEAPASDEDDPAVWRARYEEAQRYYEESQRLIGRQAQELGELRRYATEEPSFDYAPQAVAPPMDTEAMVEEHGGQRMVDWAIQNDPTRIDEIARIWALSGDPEGAVFYADYRAEQVKLDREPVQAPEQDPALTEIATQQKLADIFRSYRENDPSWSNYEAGISAAISSPETPDEIKLMLVSGDPEHMHTAVGYLKPYAQIEALRLGDQPSSPDPLQGDSLAEAERRDQIRRTAIVTGSQRLSDAGAGRETGELTSEQRIARFKEQFEELPSTDIQSGLVINGQPVVPRRSG